MRGPMTDNSADQSGDHSGDHSEDYEELRNEIDEVERQAARTVELPPRRAMVQAIAVFVLIVGLVLPWMNGASGLSVLIGDEAGRASWVPRLFAVTSLLFGVLASALTLTTRRWVFAWAGAFGGWFASVDGVLAIWSRQSSGGDLGIGLVIAVVAVVVLAANWFRTAWSRD